MIRRIAAYPNYNLLEELDELGEWYLDRKTSILYLHPGAAEADAKIEISLLDEPLIRIRGASQIRHNLLREIHGYQHGTHRVSGIYLDDGISGTTITGNIFLDIAQGVLINGGRDNRVEHNVFIHVENAMRGTDLSQAYQGWAHSSWVTLNQGLAAVPFRQAPWKDAYPALARLPDDEPQFSKNNVISENLCHAAPLLFGKEGLHARFVELGRVENNPEIGKPPGTFDPKTGRFQFNRASGAFDQIPGLQDIPCGRIGRNPKGEPKLP